MAKPGDKITIQINGVDVETAIDEHGVQRLPRDSIVDKLFYAGLLDLNKISLAAGGGYYEKLAGLTGSFTEEDRLILYRDYLGTSVCGFKDVFPKAKIKNPLWEN